MALVEGPGSRWKTSTHATAKRSPCFEYRDGEALQKSMPARLHSLIQKILVKLLDALGYEAGQEITLKLDPAYQPIPDVIAARGSIGDPCPTEPLEVVIKAQMQPLLHRGHPPDRRRPSPNQDRLVV